MDIVSSYSSLSLSLSLSLITKSNDLDHATNQTSFKPSVCGMWHITASLSLSLSLSKTSFNTNLT